VSCRQFYRIVHEALINVERHSQQKNVQVHVGRSGSRLKLTVIDNGIGRKHLREGLGGSVQWTVPEGGGTMMSAEFSEKRNT
jgi:signal transduction histidine kinase